jgi:hypothetical protein
MQGQDLVYCFISRTQQRICMMGGQETCCISRWYIPVLGARRKVHPTSYFLVKGYTLQLAHLGLFAQRRFSPVFQQWHLGNGKWPRAARAFSPSPHMLHSPNSRCKAFFSPSSQHKWLPQAQFHLTFSPVTWKHGVEHEDSQNIPTFKMCEAALGR